jgi:RHS repeat-associated protein
MEDSEGVIVDLFAMTQKNSTFHKTFKSGNMKTRNTITTIIVLLIFCFPVNSQTRTLDTSLPVGTTMGAFNVSNTGDATYNVPITVPPGTGGMVPNISINYNSSGGNSIMGIGWTLAATSAITRIPADYYHDGHTDGIDFDSDDRFALDGNRLVLITGNYGADASVYYTESESFTQIKAMGSTGNGPLWFEVKTKDGRTLQYGNTALSRVEGTGRTDVIVWYLSKVTDANGNYMTYTYHNDKTNGEYWLEKIDYTGNSSANLATYNSVVFSYQTRTDIKTDYIYGTPFKSSKYLYDIKTFCEEVQVRRFLFNYNYDNYLHLKEIVEYGTDGTTKYNSTLVNWYPQDYSGVSDTTSLPTVGGFCFSDFNGDGKTEIISLFNMKMYSLNSAGTDFDILGSTGLGTSSKFVTGDYNGDGKVDIVNPLYNSSYSFNYYKSNGTTFNSALSFGPSTAIDVTEAKLYAGDYNGDGISDILVRNPVTGLLIAFWGAASSPFSTSSTIGISWGIKQFFYDFNGDGKTEIMTVDASGYKIYEWDVSSFIVKLSNTTPTSGMEIFFGDYNGDGKTDFIYGKATSTSLISIYSCISNGNGFITNSFGFTISGSIADISVYDADGDGKDEFHHYYYLNEFIESWAYVFKNSTWSKEFGGEISGIPFYPNDYNGDGVLDFLCTSPSGNNKKILEYHYQGYLQHLVSSIVNGLNNVVNINYKPLTDPTVYLKYNTGSYPVIDFQDAGVVVSSVLYNNGRNGQNSIDYRYEGAKFDNRLKNLIGFSKITRTDNVQGLKLVDDYTVNTTYNFSQPLKSVVQTISGTLLSETNYILSTKDFANKRFWAYISRRTSIDRLHANATVISDYAYDNYGNLTSLAINSGGISTTTTTNTYVMAGAWCLNRPLTTSTTATRTGETNYTTASSFQYYSSGKLKQEIKEPGNSKQIYFNYKYDSYGNITEVRTSPDGINGRYVTYMYDVNSKGRMVTKILDMQGHFTEYSNNYQLGVVTQTKDQNNLIAKFGYNVFGRLSQTTSVDNNTSSISYAWISGGIPAYALYSQTTTRPGSTPVINYCDELGRVILQETTGFDARKLYIETSYNTKGQVDFVTLPYYSGDPNTNRKSNTYYDDGRIKTEIAPGMNISYSYNGLTTSITDNIKGQNFIRESNTDGSLKKATDAGGDITYSYFANGLTKQITALGNNTSMTYDQFGHQLSLTDPNAGATSYTYNVYGELVSQSDAKGNSTTMGYNDLGLPTYVNQPAFNTSYTYYPSGPIQTISSTNNISFNYGYDQYKRPISKSDNIQGTNLSTTNEYDSYGRVQTITYPAGFKIQYFYTNGYLSEIKRIDDGSNSSIWKLNKINARGQIVQTTAGNGLVTQRTYDDWGNLVNILTGNGAIQNLQFGYNSKGYIDRRQDVFKNKMELFDYDALGRLYKINGVQVVTYANNGNINSKTGTGTYTYSAQHPQAVSGITGNSGTISNIQQDISYTSFNKINTITEGSNNAIFTYGPDFTRKKVVTTANGILTTRYYSGNFERETKNSVTRELNYVVAYGQIVAIFEKPQSSAGIMHYVHTDHLGSILVITNQAGITEQELSYDAWGNRRDKNTWEILTAPPANLITSRGFTGHEHMDDFKLINMNGRIYDPVLGRFTSPDPFVADPTSTQDFNRYSYCVNNPLMFTDPSGYIKYEAPVIDWEAQFKGEHINLWGGGGHVVSDNSPGFEDLYTPIVGADGITHYVRNSEMTVVISNGETNIKAIAELAISAENSSILNGLSCIFGESNKYYSRFTFENRNAWFSYANDYRTGISGYYLVVTEGTTSEGTLMVSEAQGGGGNGFINFIENTSVGRDAATVVAGGLSIATDVRIPAGKPKFQPRGFNPAVEAQVAKGMKVANGVVGVAGRALGVLSIVEHGNQAYQAFDSGNMWQGIGYTALTGLDIGLMFIKSNPAVLAGSVIYGVLDATAF